MNTYKNLLAGGVAVAVLCASVEAAAQVRRFDVPAQPAVTAIPAFARQAHLQIVAPARDLEGVRTRAVSGDMDARAALRQLLQGTPLTIASDSGSLLTLRSTRRPDTAVGSVMGRILDPGTGEYLRNADVTIRASDGVQRPASSEDGSGYRASVAAGPVEIVVRYAGYEDARVLVDLAGGQTLERDIELTPADGAVAALTVIAARDGDARAIMSQRQSMNITNSLSAEAFGNVSEGNVGEFIKNMPGVDTDALDGTVRYVRVRGLPSDYASVTVNGVALASADAGAAVSNARGFSFEQVSLSSVDAIEISKTISADVDANAPAGTINLRTKRAFDRRGRSIIAQVSGLTQSDLWDNYRGGPGDKGGGRQARILPSAQIEYSDVFFDRRLGVVVSLSESNAYIQREMMTAGWNEVPTAASPAPVTLVSMRARQINQTVERRAATLSMDLRASDALTLSLTALYNEADTWSGQRSWLFTTGDRARAVTGDPLADFTTTHPNARIDTESLAVAKRGEGLTLNPRFELQGDSFVLDGWVSYSESTSKYDPMNYRGSIYSAGSLQAAGSYRAARSDLEAFDWTVTQLSGADWANPASYARPVMYLNDGRYARTELAAAAINLTWDTAIANLPITFKTGAKLGRNVYDFRNEREGFKYNYVGPVAASAFWADHQSPVELNFDENNFFLRTASGAKSVFTPNLHSLGELYRTNPEYFRASLSADDYYSAFVANRRHFEEDMNAAYLMATSTPVDRLTVRAGLRWEETRTRAQEPDAKTYAEVLAAGFSASAATGRATTIEGVRYQYESQPRIDRKGAYDYFFPSASLKYVFDEQTDLQLGYSRTIRRPGINNLAGVWAVNESTEIVSAPNPNLAPELSDNLSVRLVRYFDPVGLIAVNVFQNSIKGLFQSVDLTAEEFGYQGGEYDGYTFRTTRSAPENTVTVRGVELEFNRGLTFVPKAWGTLRLNASYTHNDADALVEGLASNLVTASLLYRYRRLSLNLNTVWSDEKPDNASGMTIKARSETNLSANYELRDGWEAFVFAKNLFDEPFVRTVDTGGLSPDLGDNYQKYGVTLSLGLRAKF
ncbi:TonB-dependent receptor [Caulobacter segnis]|uniref:TonB-dependent receptor n=1 Tax=Caulobacter segnis TaxID=88688 RepID=UPI00240ED00C|nr:TonB-dependent receptor [Caulobacter segnis]MDG2520440.1 TonB-dependent receptor [Caulobacter segnis]